MMVASKPGAPTPATLALPANPASRERLNHSGTGYFSDAVNLCQVAAGTVSVRPSRSFVSRTVITPPSLAVSRQSPPLSFE